MPVREGEPLLFLQNIIICILFSTVIYHFIGNL